MQKISDRKKAEQVLKEEVESSIKEALKESHFRKVDAAARFAVEPTIKRMENIAKSEVRTSRKLDNPPYLQVALDMPDMKSVERVVRSLPRSEKLLIEAGTPLIKRYGTDALLQLREMRPDAFIVADMKTLDVGALEARIAKEGGADAAVVSGLAFPLTIKNFINEAKRLGMSSFVDMMNVKDPVKALEEAGAVPTAVILHRGIDSEAVVEHSFEMLKSVKEKLGGRMLVGVSGGLDAELSGKFVRNGADIVIIGRYITDASDVASASDSILKLIK